MDEGDEEMDADVRKRRRNGSQLAIKKVEEDEPVTKKKRKRPSVLVEVKLQIRPM